MNTAVYLPLIACVFLGFAAPRAAGWVKPQTGAWLLTVASVVASGCGTWVLVLLAATALDDTPLRYPLGMGELPVPGTVAATAGLVLVWLLVRTWRVLQGLRSQRDRLAWVRSAPGGELVITGDTRPAAFAAYGRIVVSSGMLAILGTAGSRVLLAHERAHLRGRHPLLLAIGEITCALNPLLAPARDSAAFLCERAADEIAAQEVGSRGLVAEVIGRAALASVSRPGTVAALDGSSVVARVQALGPQKATPRAWQMTVCALVFMAVTMLASAHATADFASQLRILF